MDRELLEEYKARLADKYTGPELCELLGITEWDILEMFEERVIEFKEKE